jgi:hypothetical protein
MLSSSNFLCSVSVFDRPMVLQLLTFTQRRLRKTKSILFGPLSCIFQSPGDRTVRAIRGTPSSSALLAAVAKAVLSSTGSSVQSPPRYATLTTNIFQAHPIDHRLPLLHLFVLLLEQSQELIQGWILINLGGYFGGRDFSLCIG